MVIKIERIRFDHRSNNAKLELVYSVKKQGDISYRHVAINIFYQINVEVVCKPT